jgi:hypothetical protein
VSRPRVLLACECSGRVRDEFAKRNWEAWSADILPSETPVRITWTPERQTLNPSSTFSRTGHYQGDVRDLFGWDHPVNGQHNAEVGLDDRPLWDLIIAFPPCTDLSYAGAAWFAQKRADGRQDAAADFFMEMINAPSPHVAVENPRGVMFTRYRKPDQTVQPWWFGSPFRKATCLWLKGLPELVATHSEPSVLSTVTSGDMEGYRLHRITTGGGSSRTDKKDGVTHPAHDFNGRAHYEDSEGRKNRAKVRSRTLPEVAAAMATQWSTYVEAQNNI